MFTILCPRRSGSHLLASLLDSHPAITMYDEIATVDRTYALLPHEKLGSDMDDGEGWIVHYQELYALAALETESWDDTKWTPLIRKNMRYLLEALKTQKVIHLTRMDIRALALSYIRTHDGSKPRHPFEDDGEIPVCAMPRVQFIEQVYMIRTADTQQMLAAINDRVFNIDHRDLRSGDEYVSTWDTPCSRKLLEFLEVDPQPLTNSMVNPGGAVEIYVDSRTQSLEVIPDMSIFQMGT